MRYLASPFIRGRQLAADGNLNPDVRRLFLLPHRFLWRTSFQFLAELEWLRLSPYLRQNYAPDAERRLHNFGGDDGNRTHDPLLAGQVLSQLSYTPEGVFEFLSILKN